MMNTTCPESLRRLARYGGYPLFGKRYEALLAAADLIEWQETVLDRPGEPNG